MPAMSGGMSGMKAIGIGESVLMEQRKLDKMGKKIYLRGE